VTVGQDRLFAAVKTFGRPWEAVPVEDDFVCRHDTTAPMADTGWEDGRPALGPRWLEADVEGLAVARRSGGAGYLVVSSQGDSSLHVWRIDDARHVGAFRVRDVAETDGVDVAAVPLGARFPRGLLVVQNGKPPPPPGVREVNGHPPSGASRFELLDWGEVTAAFDPRALTPR
jgi:myo-inositol-hexaphosphate 3-phosphohydrolase